MAVLLGRFSATALIYENLFMEVPFLTAIAREYNKKITGVFLGKLPQNHLARVTASKDRYRFSIDIDDKHSKCSFHTLFYLFHEIAHIELNHFGERFFFKNQPEQADLMEMEANEWAFRAMGMIGENGGIKECDQICHECFILKHDSIAPCPKSIGR